METMARSYSIKHGSYGPISVFRGDIYNRTSKSWRTVGNITYRIRISVWTHCCWWGVRKWPGVQVIKLWLCICFDWNMNLNCWPRMFSFHNENTTAFLVVILTYLFYFNLVWFSSPSVRAMFYCFDLLSMTFILKSLDCLRCLAHWRWILPSHRNLSINLLPKLVDWFLYYVNIFR